MPKYVDENGLSHFWDNIDSYFGARSNPMYYGADPTGVTDSSAAIAACIAANKGSAIWFTKGTYKISEPIKTPHPYNDRVSIDFNGATIVSDVALDCYLDIGGLDPQQSGAAGRVRTFYMNGTFNGEGATETTGLTETGIKVRKYYKNSQIQNCNVLHFKKAIVVNESTGEPADTQISNCLLLWMDTSDANSAGITYNGSDNKLNDCHIIGFHFSIVANGGGLFADNVHNLPKGLDTSDYDTYVQQGSGAAFIAAYAGFRLTNCYCDTYETFAAIYNTSVSASFDNCTYYSYISPMPMAYVRFMTSGSASVIIRITNSSFTARPSGDASRANRSIVFSASDNNVQNLARLMLSNNVVIDQENLVAGDLFRCNQENNYFTNGSYLSAGEWLPVAVMVLPNASHAGFVDFTVTRYFSSGVMNTVNVLGKIDLNTTTHAMANAAYIKAISSDYPYNVGYNLKYDSTCNVYYLVFYESNPSGAVSTNYGIEFENHFLHPMVPFNGVSLTSYANVLGLENIDNVNVTQVTVTAS